MGKEFQALSSAERQARSRRRRLRSRRQSAIPLSSEWAWLPAMASRAEWLIESLMLGRLRRIFNSQLRRSQTPTLIVKEPGVLDGIHQSRDIRSLNLCQRAALSISRVHPPAYTRSVTVQALEPHEST